MADDPSFLASEAKTLVQALKSTLNSRDPWDKEVEFQRRNLQKQYLLLLLTHPHAKESKDIEIGLWMNTSHVLIGPYKKRISEIEDALRQANTQKQQAKRQQQQHGPVEHRKLVHRYRQYLAGEEKFWMQLIARLHVQFALHEADRVLASLGITSADDGQGSRSHFQFPAPPEGTVPPSDAAERKGHIATLAKALICLGDLARYRELASDTGPRRADDAAKRGGRSNRGKQAAASIGVVPKTLDKSRALYEAARSLAPEDGNPSAQLAILALNKRDSFEGVVQSYRALCARQPYETAAGNLASILRGAAQKYMGKQSAPDGSAPRKPTVETFKRDTVVLHASCRSSGDGNLAQRLAASVTSDYAKLISDRLLPVDTIIKVLTLTQGTLWRIGQDRSAKQSSYLDIAPPLVLASLLSLYRALFDTGIRELQEPATPDGHDLAMRITAVLRRMLPALRVAGKWLRVKHNFDLILASSSPATQSFWESYSAFSTCLAAIFPPELLPTLKRPLEEDVELAGFLPLGGLLLSGTSPEVLASEDRRTLEEVHPNEEQLMRIWDIWHDATAVADRAPAQMRSFRVHASGGQQPSKTQAPVDVSVPQPRAAAVSDRADRYPVARTVSSVDEDARTETTDPVGDAFRQALGEDDDSDGEEILFNPRASIVSMAPEDPMPTYHTPTKQLPSYSFSSGGPLLSARPTPPADVIIPPAPSVTGPVSNLAVPTRLPAHRSSFSSPTPSVPHTPKTTAQDLLANVLGHGAPSRAARRVSQSSPFVPTHISTHSAPDPTAPSLIASNNPGAALGTGHSIWSASADENPSGAHHRRLSQSGLHGATSLRSVSQPPPWAGTSERVSGQQPLYHATPPPIHSAAPPTAFSASHQPSVQANSAIGIGTSSSGAQARRRLSGTTASSLLAQHSYLPSSSSQPVIYASPSHPQTPTGPALPRMVDNMHLGGIRPLETLTAAQTVGEDLRHARAYNAIGGMPTGGTSYMVGLQQAGLGVRGGIWGPAG